MVMPFLDDIIDSITLEPEPITLEPEPIKTPRGTENRNRGIGTGTEKKILEEPRTGTGTVELEPEPIKILRGTENRNRYRGIGTGTDKNFERNREPEPVP